MPVPPILEVFLVWHPSDDVGKAAADVLAAHFHSASFSGLAGGAVELYVRSEGWEREGGAPRPLAFMSPWPHGLPEAQFTAVVPVMGVGMARAFANDSGWKAYLEAIFDADGKKGVGVYPLRDPGAQIQQTALSLASQKFQALAEECSSDAAMLCRELSQAIAQRLSSEDGERDRIKVFISHTKHHSFEEQDTDGQHLFERVRDVIRTTRLAEFFDASDLQPGSHWEQTLDSEAGRCALLMVRTDRYAGREWTQREVLVAKKHGVPVVGLHALRSGEDRGSFIMDHVPTLPCNLDNPEPDITKALNRVVDEALKRALWKAQTVYMTADGFDWLPVHAPEPVTAGPWLRQHQQERPGDKHVWVIHPDPPLGPKERDVIVELCALAGFSDKVDIFTPRTFAARGGTLPS
jgi:hypothetical protein